MKKVLSLAAMFVFFIGFAVAQVPVITKADVKKQAKAAKTEVKTQAKTVKSGTKKVGIDAKNEFTKGIKAHQQQAKKNTASADSSKKAAKAKIYNKVQRVKKAIVE